MPQFSAADPIVILSYARTPMGGMQGALADVSATDLGATAIKAAVDRAGVHGGVVGLAVLRVRGAVPVQVAERDCRPVTSAYQPRGGIERAVAGCGESRQHGPVRMQRQESHRLTAAPGGCPPGGLQQPDDLLDLHACVGAEGAWAPALGDG